MNAVAHGVALAFLDGDWSPPAMAMRAGAVFGRPRPMLSGVARRAVARFPVPPHDAAGALARFVAGDAAFRRAVTRMRRADDAWLRRWHTPEPRMGDPPPALRGIALPELVTTVDLARFLGVDGGRLRFLADPLRWNRDRPDPFTRHYRYRWVPKRSGSWRLLEAPKPRLMAVQRRILREILEPVPVHEAVHGFRRGRSVVSYVEPHCGRRVVVRLDLAEFFTRIAEPRVRGMFRTLGYPEPVARLLACLCCAPAPPDVVADRPFDEARLTERMHQRTLLLEPHLPQGAPTSPALANLAAFRMDVRLAGLARAHGAAYTRYADDLAFSGDAGLETRVDRLIGAAGAIALEEGFAVRFRKTRVMRSGRRQQLCGITINRRPSLPRAELDRLKAILHNCARHGPATQNRGGVADLRAHLSGRVGWAEMVHPARGAKLRRLFDGIAW
jgi:hypothetical protein